MKSERERNQLIVEKLNQGFSLGEIQKQLEEEHDIRMTYMDLRILATELEGVDWSQQPETGFKAKAVAQDDLLGGDSAPASGTRVTVSKLARPGAAMHGSVEFSSGAKAEWFLDHSGRLGLQSEPGSAKPNEKDLQEFQEELQRVVAG